ncbi:MAG: class I SAM-dependent methyltransferase [Nanoarchaeota archaeon]
MKNQEKIWDIEYKRNAVKWHRETKTLPNLLKSKRVLELGVGNGKTLWAILKQKPREIVAIDSSKEAIKQCERIFAGGRVLFKKSNILHLPFGEGEFDIIICYYILNNLTEKERISAIREICRVLKKKGLVIFEDFAAGDFRNIHKKEKKKNGLYRHFFTGKEIAHLFKDFLKIKLKEKTTKPILHKPELVRKILFGVFEK